MTNKMGLETLKDRQPQDAQALLQGPNWAARGEEEIYD